MRKKIAKSQDFENLIFSTDVADSFIKISGGLVQLANIDPGPLDKHLAKLADTFEKVRVSNIPHFYNFEAIQKYSDYTKKSKG